MCGSGNCQLVRSSRLRQEFLSKRKPGKITIDVATSLSSAVRIGAYVKKMYFYGLWMFEQFAKQSCAIHQAGACNVLRPAWRPPGHFDCSALLHTTRGYLNLLGAVDSGFPKMAYLPSNGGVANMWLLSYWRYHPRSLLSSKLRNPP